MLQWCVSWDVKGPRRVWQKEMLGEWLGLEAQGLVNRAGDDGEAEGAVKKSQFSTGEERNENVTALYWCGKL